MLTSNLPSKYLMKADGNLYGQGIDIKAVNMGSKWLRPPRPRVRHSEVGLTFTNPWPSQYVQYAQDHAWSGSPACEPASPPTSRA